MIDERVSGIKLTAKTKNGNFTNSNISLLAVSSEIFELANLINSLQNDPCTEIVKSVTAELKEYA